MLGRSRRSGSTLPPHPAFTFSSPEVVFRAGRSGSIGRVAGPCRWRPRGSPQRQHEARHHVRCRRDRPDPGWLDVDDGRHHGISSDQHEGGPLSAGTTAINILNLNDFHGRIDTDGKGTLGKNFACTILTQREQLGAANTLTLGAGDLIGASPFTSSIQNDEPTLDYLNAIGMNASAMGNHEFDQGYDDLTQRVEPRVDYEYLGANVLLKGTQTPALKTHQLYDVAGVRVAVIGAVTSETPNLVEGAGVAALDIIDPVDGVNRVVAQLTDGTPPTARPTSSSPSTTRAGRSRRRRARSRTSSRSLSSRTSSTTPRPRSQQSCRATPTRRTSTTCRSPARPPAPPGFGWRCQEHLRARLGRRSHGDDGPGQLGAGHDARAVPRRCRRRVVQADRQDPSGRLAAHGLPQDRGCTVGDDRVDPGAC